MIFNKLFNKKATPKTRGWETLTVGEFLEIEKLTHNPDNTTVFKVKQFLYGDEGGDISFINQAPPKVDCKKRYTINGHNYDVHADITKMTTSAYIDYAQSKTLIDYLSVCLVPHSAKKYNDGSYDLSEVRKDIALMRFIDAAAIANFIKLQSVTLLLLIQDCSLPAMIEKGLQKSKMSRAEKARIRQQVMESSNLLQASLKDLI